MPLPPLVVSGQVIAAAHVNAIRNYLPLMADGTTGTPGLRFEDDPDTGFHRSGSNQLAIVTGGAARVTVSDDGALVWGASDASEYQLTVGHTSAGSQKAGLNFRIDSSNLWQLFVDNSDGNKFKLNTSVATALAVDASGNVGIGTTSPTQALDVAGGIIASAGVIASSFGISGANPSISWSRTGAPANQKHWIVSETDDSLQIYTIDDAFGTPYVCFQITRSAGVPASTKLWIGGSLRTLSLSGSNVIGT